MRKTLLLLFTLISGIDTFAQVTPLPYYTGFETAAEKAGWVQFTKGNVSSELWTIGPYPAASTSPNLLVSPNAEFMSSSLTDTINQWYLSPRFNFHTGGKIDSLSIKVFGASGSAQAGDSIVIYLLQGSNDPSLATSKTRLANLTTMVSGFSGTMRDTGNFIIPPTSGVSYIAFKYHGVYDWFQVYIDSIYISGNSLVGVPEQKMNNVVSIYPNPANTEIKILFPASAAGSGAINIINMLGQNVFTQHVADISRPLNMDIRHLPEGVYSVHIVTGQNETSLQKLVITH